MKNKLFWRLFWAFLATLLLTALVLSSLVVVLVKEERQGALEAEVMLQARDVARLLRQMDSVRYQRPGRSNAWSDTLQWKIEEIREGYDAAVWVASGDGKSLLLTGEQTYTKEQLNDPAVAQQILRVLEGEEIRVQGLVKELGPHIVTLGVPIQSEDGTITGAVLLHISVESLAVDFSDIVRDALIASGVALVLGIILAYLISARQTKRLRSINSAVTEFAKGKLDQRVEIRGNDELTGLSQSFNKMAEDLSRLEESRRSFVASVSHELRSPLTCISGYVQGMMDGTIAEGEHQKYLGVVENETARLTKMVNELLDLSKFESGNFPLTLSRFDINELIRVELLKFEQQIEDKRIDVSVEFKEQVCYVSADADRIRQVLTNLIDNAVKFSPESGALSLNTHSVGTLCYVRVSNSGEGIAKEDIPFIFDRFFKGDKAHTSGKGTGLGLSIVKRILEQHGQMIQFESGANLTSFSFTLVKADAADQ